MQIAEPVALDRLPILDYGSPGFREDSVHLLAAACAAGPVCRVLPFDALGVLRFRDVDAILRDPRTFSSKVSLIPQPDGTEPVGTLIGDDPPAHTRLRALLGQLFTAARVTPGLVRWACGARCGS